jgi:hypothetical protein
MQSPMRLGKLLFRVPPILEHITDLTCLFLGVPREHAFAKHRRSPSTARRIVLQRP